MASALSRRTPLADLADLRSWMEQALEESGPGGWRPAVDVIREPGAIVLRADLPGVKPEDITIEVEDGVLTISGSHEETTEEKDKSYVRRERRYGSFSRSMSLPPGVGANDVEATVDNGVLEVRVPMPEPEEKKTVTITPKRA
jgi:HSP20 family protein